MALKPCKRFYRGDCAYFYISFINTLLIVFIMNEIKYKLERAYDTVTTSILIGTTVVFGFAYFVLTSDKFEEFEKSQLETQIEESDNLLNEK